MVRVVHIHRGSKAEGELVVERCTGAALRVELEGVRLKADQFVRIALAGGEGVPDGQSVGGREGEPPSLSREWRWLVVPASASGCIVIEAALELWDASRDEVSHAVTIRAWVAPARALLDAERLRPPVDLTSVRRVLWEDRVAVATIATGSWYLQERPYFHPAGVRFEHGSDWCGPARDWLMQASPETWQRAVDVVGADCVRGIGIEHCVVEVGYSGAATVQSGQVRMLLLCGPPANVAGPTGLAVEFEWQVVDWSPPLGSPAAIAEFFADEFGGGPRRRPRRMWVADLERHSLEDLWDCSAAVPLVSPIGAVGDGVSPFRQGREGTPAIVGSEWVDALFDREICESRAWPILDAAHSAFCDKDRQAEPWWSRHSGFGWDRGGGG